MKYTQEENLEIKGFKDGYFLMKHQEKLMNLFLKTNNHDTAYMKGLKKGTQEYEQEKKVELDKQILGFKDECHGFVQRLDEEIKS